MSSKSFTSAGRLKVAAGVSTATDRRPGGWAINDDEQAQIIDLASDAVPSDATFIGGSAYKTDGSRYVTFEAPSGAQFIGGQAIRSDGALHMTTASPDVHLGQWGHTEDGAACAEAEIAVVSDGTLFDDATFTRADPAPYFDASGLLQTASANEARTTYIGGNPYLWLDGAVTEISGKSNDLDGWTGGTAQAVKNATGLDGSANGGWTVTDSDAGSAELIQTSANITSGTATYYGVFAVGKDNSPSVYPAVYVDVTGGTNRQQRVIVDPSDGSTVISLANGSLVMEPVLFNESWLMVLSITDNASGNTLAGIRVRPAWNADGSATLDNTVTGSTIFRYAGLFKDNFSLMPILTTGGTTATVAADVASLANSVISGLTEGTIYMEIWTPQLTSNAARHIAELESDASNFIRVQHATDGDLDAQITDGGVSQATLAGTDLTVGTLQKVALAFSGDDFALYRDGNQLDTDSGGTVPTVDTLLIGAGLYGGIRNMNVYTSRLSNSQLASMTT